MRLDLVVASLLLGTVLSACTTTGSPAAESSQNRPSGSSAHIRQTDSSGNRLPFETEFPNRWSINNDGTPYEPCTAVTPDTLRRFTLDADSVDDVAASDFQTARGCQWKFLDENRSTLAQQVGNLVEPAAGLTGYKELSTSGAVWYPDYEIDGRRVVMSSLFPGECGVVVQSRSAVVATSVLRFGVNRPPQEVICKTASEFLQATIAKIPT